MPSQKSKLSSENPNPNMSVEEKILQLFDSCWFESKIFTRTPLSRIHESDAVLEKIQQAEEEPKISGKKEAKISKLPTLHIRSMSEQLLSCKTSFLCDSFSLNTVLIITPKLETILSGKEVTEFSSEKTEEPIRPKLNLERRERRKKREKGGSSKSLTELEFEELKGFMDLGFVFSEEDKDSSLVSIIPGLHRLGRENEKEEEKIEESVVNVSRPYLSEAWDVLDQRKIENPILKNWRVPTSGNEIDMKDHLRFWAHTVASTVR